MQQRCPPRQRSLDDVPSRVLVVLVEQGLKQLSITIYEPRFQIPPRPRPRLRSQLNKSKASIRILRRSLYRGSRRHSAVYTSKLKARKKLMYGQLMTNPKYCSGVYLYTRIFELNECAARAAPTLALPVFGGRNAGRCGANIACSRLAKSTEVIEYRSVMRLTKK